MTNLVGQYIGRYHILEQVGTGGLATVYKALDTRLERYVAVKVVFSPREVSNKFLKRFEREAKALALISHPNIVKVLDYGEHENMPYLILEYISGVTLKQRLGKPVPWQETAQLLSPIAHALYYAHQMHIMHWDVKPSNILIADTGRPMLSDFGITWLLESEEASDIASSGVGYGTPEYMAPEKITGIKVDYRADIYSLGIVFYELITGHKPYQADTPMAVLWKHVKEPLPRPKNFVIDLPDEVENILLKALAKDPDDRYQNMNEFAVALDSLPTKHVEKDSHSKKPLRVFLCHASNDKPAVRELYHRLIADGIDVWLDEENLLPGQDWQLEIPDAVRLSDVVIICLSKNSITKEGYIQKEIKYALDIADEKLERSIFIIPLKLEDCNVPERLSKWQWVEIFHKYGYKKLISALKLRESQIGMISPN